MKTLPSDDLLAAGDGAAVTIESTLADSSGTDVNSGDPDDDDPDNVAGPDSVAADSALAPAPVAPPATDAKVGKPSTTRARKSASDITPPLIAAAPAISVELGRYIVCRGRRVRHNGLVYAENTPIELSADDFERLNRLGYVRAPSDFITL